MTREATAPAFVEHAFRHEYGRLVARLSRAFGVYRTELVEDAVSAALLAALRHWAKHGPPDNPSAWLYRVARNQIVDDLRRADAKHASLPDEREMPEHDLGSGSLPDEPTFADEVADDQLRMLFICADPEIPEGSQLVLALKILCGFSTREIALRLFTNEETVQKRLMRGRDRLRELGPTFETPSLAALATRREAVLRTVFLLFNEGYSSMQPDRLIRRELCDEAIRLGELLAAHPACASSEGDALLALMHLHAARFEARLDGNGGLLLLEEQDRTKWDRHQIALGLSWLARSARGDRFTRYHAEAAVAAEHCVAPSYAATRWSEIVELYEMLERFAPSPIHALNRAIALAEWQGPEAGLAVLHALRPPAWLAGYYLWDATLGELERRAGHVDRARHHLERALEAAPHPAEKALIERRLQTLRG